MKFVLARKKPRALGCHIYAGGFTLGVRKFFDVQAHLEEWEFGTNTVRKNMPNIPIHVSEFGKEWPAEDFAGVELLYGNPPCTSWSQAGTLVGEKTKFNKDRYKHHALTRCTDLLFTLIPRVKPKFFVWECVAAAMTNGRAFVEEKTAWCMKQGYSVTHLLFDGIDTGLPQHRRRFFFVAHRYKFDPQRPNEPHIVAGDVLENFEDDKERRPKAPANIERNVLSKTKKSGRLSKLFMEINKGKILKRGDRGQVLGRPGFLNYRLDAKAPSPTITGGPHIYHPTEMRALTIEEQAAMCGYPDGYEFVGPIGDCYKQIAKAVLPPPATWLARNIRKAIDARVPISQPNVHLVDFLRTKG